MADIYERFLKEVTSTSIPSAPLKGLFAAFLICFLYVITSVLEGHPVLGNVTVFHGTFNV